MDIICSIELFRGRAYQDAIKAKQVRFNVLRFGSFSSCAVSTQSEDYLFLAVIPSRIEIQYCSIDELMRALRKSIIELKRYNSTQKI